MPCKLLQISTKHFTVSRICKEPLGKNRRCFHRIDDGQRWSCNATIRWGDVRGNGGWGNGILWNRNGAPSEDGWQIKWRGSGYSWTTIWSEETIVWKIWQVYQFGGEVVISPGIINARIVFSGIFRSSHLDTTIVGRRLTSLKQITIDFIIEQYKLWNLYLVMNGAI